MTLVPMEQQAAIASIGRGELQHIRLLAEDLYSRLGSLEENANQGQPVKNQSVQGIDPVDPPADDAKSVDVRESVIEIAERFNQLLDALKNG